MDVINRLGEFLLKNPWQAGFVAMLLGGAPLAGIPLVAGLSYIIVALVTLRNGPSDGLIVFIMSALMPLVAGWHMEAWFWVLYQVIAGSFAVYAFSVLLRSSASWSLVVQVAAAVGMVIVLMINLWVDDLQGFWIAEFNRGVAQLSAAADMDPSQLEAQAKLGMSLLLPIVTGFTVAWLLMVSVIHLGLGRWWQARMFNPVGLRPELLNIRLSNVFIAGFVLLVLAAEFVTPVAWDVLMPLTTAMIVGGLSFIHFYCDKRQNGSMLIVLFYILLILGGPYVLGAIALLAVADSVLDLRQRLTTKRG